ncbi:MAG: four helix bundle protein [Sedimentisphaerales bacterium]|nr:four helix bundle protein [Sedimentisphaerales bacterium]
MPRDFKNIKAWQYADDLALLVYSKTKSFPKEELYGITSQLRRAVVSIPTNIAEGASREHKKEYLYFLYIAKGSMAEVEYLLHLSKRIGYFKKDEYIQIEELRKEGAKTLHGLIKAVSKEVNK